jgi:hypothetical protein
VRGAAVGTPELRAMQRRAAVLRRCSLGKRFPVAKTSTSECYAYRGGTRACPGDQGKARASTMTGAGRGQVGLAGELAVQSNFITEEVHLDGQGRSYRVVAGTRRPPTAK